MSRDLTMTLGVFVEFTLSQLADELGVPFSGNGQLKITHACGLGNMSAGGLG